MATTTLPQRPTAPVRGQAAAGPPGQPILGNALQFQRDPLGFLMRTAADYGDVARYRLGNIAFHQVNHPDGAQRILQDNQRNDNFALLEATLILAAVAQRYRLRLPPGATVTPRPQATLRPAGGLHMMLAPLA